MTCVPMEDSNQPVPLTGRTESSLGAHVILMVISCGSSFSIVNIVKVFKYDNDSV